ncbi:CD109 antigen-like isoform X2 [Ruditapes philippinarum]|uniref:CD109 antigen-like isoform X2 n=1 Tax=Ruditapes philippinarum TaxID=129788 RepID=UPI00295B0061|nr:CD109 antigen-like isoform X2 [Ruditapes philippinarum]
MDRDKIRMRLWVISVIHALMQAVVQGKNSYILMSPRIVRPGRNLTIEGELLENPSEPVIISAELSNNAGPIANSTVTVNGKSKMQLDIPVPNHIIFDSGSSKRKELNLKISGSGGLSFTDAKTLSYNAKSSSVFIQTDKAIYKPGQPVHFRVFGVTPELKVIFDKLQVELYDPNGNKINQWDVSGFKMTKLGGVYVQHQLMSEQPVLGKWKLKAKLLSYGEEFEEKSFEVDEYVLPKFETELDLPSFGRTDVPKFTGKVKAKYTFGKPVKGIVDILIRPKNERFQWINGSRQRVSKVISLQMPITGEVKFTIKMTELTDIQKFLSGSTLVFEANVTEDVTKFKRSDIQEITFFSQPIKLSFLTSLPDTFKPGMTYDAVVIVAQRDDSVPDMINGKLKITITEYRKQHRRPFFMDRSRINSMDRSRINSMASFRAWRRRRPTWQRDTKKVLGPFFHAIPADGVVVFPIETESGVIKLDVKAEYNGASTFRTLKKRHSPSNTYLQMRLLTSYPKAGSTVDLEIRSTHDIHGDLSYQIYSRGSIVESGTIPMSNRRQKWTFNVTSAMAPKAKVVIYFVRSDGEVIADVLAVNVQGVFQNKVNIKFNQTSAEPIDKISLDVKADNGSTVHVLGVDKSVLLMATGNDITESQVNKEIRRYAIKPRKTSSSFSGCNWRCMRMPIPVGGEDVMDVFNDAGVIVFTDALIYEHKEVVKRKEYNRKRKTKKKKQPSRKHQSTSSNKMAPFKSKGSKEAENVAPIRKHFPETWIWSSFQIQSNGTVSIEETVPDTITSWVATAFAIHPDSGLGISSSAAQLEVTMPFFVSVNLPYSVVRGEKVIIQVNIHNYSPQQLFTSISLKKSSEFDYVKIEGTKTSIASIDAFRTVTVGADEVLAVYFPIIPRKIGLVDINVQAKTPIQADAVKKKLLVEAEGTPREYNLPILVDLRNSGTVTKTVNTEYPLRTVKGSERITATVIGDLMGPSINGLDKLLKLPTGCGEQNMLKFAPNIYIVKYLEATNNLNENIMDKAKNFLTTGYQRELTYAHTDGSFSAFGKRDKRGSTWLTAFVLKSFVQAKPYIFVDDDVINKAVDFLIDQQNADGTFREPGNVLNKAMQGGSTSGNVTLTAYVMISLLEARVVKGVAKKISMVQTKALSYLENEVPTLTDVYDLSIVGYALQLAQSSQASLVWTKLDAKAKTEAGTKHWEKVKKGNANIKPWEKRNGVAEDIEMTSYALLTLANKNDSTDPSGVQVLKWVTEQRNPNGGFSSTQDTVIALQGLAEMAALIYSPVHDVTIKIEGTGFSDTLKIQNTNAQVLQSRDLPPNVGAVTVTATGTGLALVQIEVSYNIDSDDQKQSFQLNVAIPRETANDFDVMVCARWLEEGSSSMAVMEIGSPSGFVGDLVSVYSKPDHKRADIDLRKIILYFDEIDAGETCSTVTMQRVGLVAGVQPVAVRIYDYYEPTKQVTEFYIPEVIRRSEVCEICGKDCDFCL